MMTIIWLTVGFIVGLAAGIWVTIYWLAFGFWR
jgi:hypothetical protein